MLRAVLQSPRAGVDVRAGAILLKHSPVVRTSHHLRVGDRVCDLSDQSSHRGWGHPFRWQRSTIASSTTATAAAAAESGGFEAKGFDPVIRTRACELVVVDIVHEAVLAGQRGIADGAGEAERAEPGRGLDLVPRRAAAERLVDAADERLDGERVAAGVELEHGLAGVEIHEENVVDVALGRGEDLREESAVALGGAGAAAIAGGIVAAAERQTVWEQTV